MYKKKQISKSELYQGVEDYCYDWIGEPDQQGYIRDLIDGKQENCDDFEQYMEWYMEIYCSNGDAKRARF